MVYRKLLLPLTDAPGGQAALATGLSLAATWHAHLQALIVQVDSRSVAPLAGEGLSGAMIEDMMAAAERQGGERTRHLAALFARAAEAHAIPTTLPVHATSGATAGLLTLTGREEDIIPAQARIADLTILPHPDEEEDAAASDSLHAVLFDSGRPVLIAPSTVPATIGRRCCIAWNGTAEGTAALWAMLPWLQKAETVRVLHAADYQRRGPEAAELLPYLALHGIQADIAEFKPLDRNTGAGLLAAAAEFGADLLGMGAYSHSRLRQLILGGVTRHILGRAALPVLMCH